MKNNITEQKTLKSLDEIKQFFKENQTPIYFIGATNFNLLGIDEWVSNFRKIAIYIFLFTNYYKIFLFLNFISMVLP